MAGVTLDSGALIAFERGERRMLAHLKEIQGRDADLTVPSIVIAEVWRGGRRSARMAALLAACVIDPLHAEQARLAGEALGAVKHAGVVDAIVMASAARRGDHVLTSDFDDLSRLRAHFPDVRVVRV
jgi:predicted nucleic acid-binding protein